MKNNRINIALRFSQVTLGVILLLFFGFSTLLTLSLFEHPISNSLLVSNHYKPHFGLVDLKWCSDCVESGTTLSQLHVNMKLWILVRGVLLFGVTVLIFLQIIQVLKSLKEKLTFYETNISGLNRLALYGIFISFLSSVNFLVSESQFNVYTSIPFGPLAFTFGCKVLAEIFEEGKRLREDNNSIV